MLNMENLNLHGSATFNVGSDDDAVTSRGWHYRFEDNDVIVKLLVEMTLKGIQVEVSKRGSHVIESFIKVLRQHKHEHDGEAVEDEFQVRGIFY